MSIILFIVALIVFAIIGAIWGNIGAIWGNDIKRVRPLYYAILSIIFLGAGFIFLTCYEDFMLWANGIEKYSYGWFNADYTGQALNFFLFFSIIAILMMGLCWISSEKRKEDLQHELYLQGKKDEEELKRRIDSKYNKDLENITNEYGTITKNIEIKEKSVNDSVIIFAETKKIWMLGKIVDFKDILGCSLSDNSHTERGTVKYETKTSTGSMLGRAVVGGVLTGGVGAVVGGATAKKNTITVPQGNDKVIHDYTVLVNVNSLENPLLRINCGKDGAKANDVIAVINVIIRQNYQ